MNFELMAYLIFGSVLVILFLWIIIYNYSKKRHDHIEEAKFRMLEDDDLENEGNDGDDD